MENRFDKSIIRLANEQQIVDYVSVLLNRLSSKHRNSSIQHLLLAEKLTEWLNGTKNTWELDGSESQIFELFSADVYENFSKSISSFKLMFMPGKVKFDPSEIVFVNLYSATYNEKIDFTSEKYISSDNTLRVYYLKKCFRFIVNNNYLHIDNENDPNDLCQKTLYLPFIERIWIHQGRIGFSSKFKEIRILYHNKEDVLLNLTQSFYSMSEDEYKKIIPFLLKHQPYLRVGI